MRIYYFPMSVEEFRKGLAATGITQAEFARLLNLADRTVRMWANGERETPSYAAVIMRLLVSRELSVEQIEAAISTPYHQSSPEQRSTGF